MNLTVSASVRLSVRMTPEADVIFRGGVDMYHSGALGERLVAILETVDLHRIRLPEFPRGRPRKTNKQTSFSIPKRVLMELKKVVKERKCSLNELVNGAVLAMGRSGLSSSGRWPRDSERLL